MELRDLRFFCLTAEIEHVTKAADRLGVAQPFLTRIIKQIEEEIGGELFEKVGRRIKLNSNGEVFYKYAKQVLADMDSLYSEMDYVFDRREQTITLLCNTESFATRLIIAFRDQNPDYALSVLNVTKQEMIEALTTGEAQFGLSYPPIKENEGLNLVTKQAFSAKGIVLLPPGHALLAKSPITLDDLRGERLVTMPRNSGMRNKLDPIFEKYDFHPQIVFESNNLNMITQAVHSGFGYAFVTPLIMEDYPEMRKYCVDIDIPEVVGDYGLTYNKLTVDNRNARHFRDFVLEFLENLQTHFDDWEIRPDPGRNIDT
ncbi:MAG: LysR family transcriptional regulator [Oscillospiraceae bacterium]|nr:LysR family transcriptional regulator [Oscillospiraceae bacterium]